MGAILRLRTDQSSVPIRACPRNRGARRTACLNRATADSEPSVADDHLADVAILLSRFSPRTWQGERRFYLAGVVDDLFLPTGVFEYDGDTNEGEEVSWL